MCRGPVVVPASGKIQEMTTREKTLSLHLASLCRPAMNLVQVARSNSTNQSSFRVARHKDCAVTGYVYVRMEKITLSIITEK
jgi:hypothetical protein